MKTNAFVRKLASNDRRTRERAFTILKKYISSESHTSKLSLLDFEKLWMGLYYTMWFSDRPLPQQRLCVKMASLFSESIPQKQFTKFVTAFWVIMAKEWTKIDRWRVDKYLLLIRYIVKACFERLKYEDYDEDFVNDYINTLEETILSGSTTLPGLVVFHLVDVWLDEIADVAFEDIKEEEEKEAKESNDKKTTNKKPCKLTDEERAAEKQEAIAKIPVGKLLKPFEKLCKESPTKGLRLRIKDSIFDDERLQEWGIDLSQTSTISHVNKGSVKEDDVSETKFGS